MTELDSLRLNVGEFVFDALAAGPTDGEFVLMLHGWPEFADCWTPYLHALASDGYRAMAVDQRGYSPGARPPEIADYAVDNLVADALGVADAQGATRFHLVAHDWGGMVAWALTSAHPDRVQSLSVLATPHPLALQQAAKADEGQSNRLGYVHFFQQSGHIAEQALLADGGARLRGDYGGHIPPEQVDRNIERLAVPGALTATLNWYRATDADFTVPAGPITVPTLYVWGSEDAALGRGAAEATGDFVTAPYQFVILDGMSHWLPEQAPDQVLPLLRKHIAAYRD
ncbi:MAG TPA: alpha/beta hydrolase [Pseudonocardiaceae bacterium]|jgi:pimeloyl-ACP methyl ester carboxylesterase|nr:alpha/beta hydrolase [Pseudonocardiaceae bacterium]